MLRRPAASKGSETATADKPDPCISSRLCRVLWLLKADGPWRGPGVARGLELCTTPDTDIGKRPFLGRSVNKVSAARQSGRWHPHRPRDAEREHEKGQQRPVSAGPDPLPPSRGLLG